MGLAGAAPLGRASIRDERLVERFLSGREGERHEGAGSSDLGVGSAGAERGLQGSCGGFVAQLELPHERGVAAGLDAAVHEELFAAPFEGERPSVVG